MTFGNSVASLNISRTCSYQEYPGSFSFLDSRCPKPGEMVLDPGLQAVQKVVAGEIVTDRGDGDHPPPQGAAVRILFLVVGQRPEAGDPVIGVIPRVHALVEALHQTRPPLLRHHDAPDLLF